MHLPRGARRPPAVPPVSAGAGLLCGQRVQRRAVHRLRELLRTGLRDGAWPRHDLPQDDDPPGARDDHRLFPDLRLRCLRSAERRLHRRGGALDLVRAGDDPRGAARRRPGPALHRRRRRQPHPRLPPRHRSPGRLRRFAGRARSLRSAAARRHERLQRRRLHVAARGSTRELAVARRHHRVPSGERLRREHRLLRGRRPARVGAADLPTRRRGRLCDDDAHGHLLLLLTRGAP